jgi:hypothetical protein
MSCDGGHLGFPIGIKNNNLVKDIPMIFNNLKVFCSDMKFKMVAMAGLSLTLDPMGKMFQNASSGPMLIYVLRWWPSWISDRHKKQKLFRGPSNDHSCAVWFQLS